jgi:hypothetical protein
VLPPRIKTLHPRSTKGAVPVTVVVGVATYFDGIVAADCQVTFSNGRRRDYCQKLIVANARSVIGLAGDICMARYLADGVLGRLRETDIDHQDWLREDRQLARFILEGIYAHGAKNPGHENCADGCAELLIFWRDYHRMSPERGWRGPPIPDPRIITIRASNRRVDIERIRRGVGVIGRNRAFQRELNTPNFDDLVTYFGRYDGERNVRDTQRALIATTEISKRLIEMNRTAGVGGLYQVMTVSPDSVQTVPYFQLMDVAPGYRTYVAMRIENGEWIQEHRPTARKVRVISPWAINPFGPGRIDSVFDPSQWLTPESPGVIPAQEWETVFSLYNPPDMPDAVRPSWGDAPLSPLSYGLKWWDGPNQPAWVGDNDVA